jgi:hypothetical protein
MGSKPSGISGSRSSIILGLNKYQTPFEVWQRIMEEREPGFNAKAGYILPEDPDNAPIRWGNAFESAVLELTEQSGDSLIGDRERFYQHDNGFLTCHIDGLFEDGTLYEGKSTNIFTWNDEWGEPGSDKIPQEYAIQVQHNMMLTGAEECILSVLVFPKRVEEFEKEGWIIRLADDGLYDMKKNDSSWSNDTILYWASQLSQMGFFHQYHIKANKNIQDKLLAIYAKWWQDHILNRIPPEPTSYEDILRILPKPHGIVVVEPDHEILFRKYKKANKIIKRLGEYKDEIKINILSTLSSDSTEDEDAVDKIIFKDQAGEKLASFSGKRFTVR